jgi:Ice-binding-like/Bacterial Ig-like domain
MRRLKFVVPFLLLAACGGSDGGGAGDSPTVTSTIPASAAASVAVNLPISATFDREMDPATLSSSTVVLKQGAAVVPGVVTYGGNTVTLMPAAALAPGVMLTATITTGSADTTGMALAHDYTWSFTTVTDAAPPAVTATLPANAAVNVSSRQQLSATFNKAMDPATLVAGFTVMQGATPVAGLVSYQAATNTATFVPTVALGAALVYTATISTAAKSATGALSLAAAYSWSFTTRAAGAADLPVNLGTAGNYGILAKTKISTVPTSSVTGNIAISPAAATYITGFALKMDPTTTFSTSTQVTGKIYAANYTAPTSSNLTVAINDMATAFTDAAGRAPDVTELGAGNIGGKTLAPGVYKWSSGLLIPTDVHLAGSSTDVWIFQVAQNLTISSGAKINLDGAVARNVFWQVSGLVDLGTTAHAEGTILCKTGITLHTGASVNGRLLAQTAVIIDGSTIVAPAQ